MVSTAYRQFSMAVTANADNRGHILVFSDFPLHQLTLNLRQKLTAAGTLIRFLQFFYTSGVNCNNKVSSEHIGSVQFFELPTSRKSQCISSIVRHLPLLPYDFVYRRLTPFSRCRTECRRNRKVVEAIANKRKCIGFFVRQILKNKTSLLYL